MFVLGLALYVPLWSAAAGREPAAAAPWLLLAGLVLGAIGLALRPHPGPVRAVVEPTWFPADSTEFALTQPTQPPPRA